MDQSIGLFFLVRTAGVGSFGSADCVWGEWVRGACMGARRAGGKAPIAWREGATASAGSPESGRLCYNYMEHLTAPEHHH